MGNMLNLTCLRSTSSNSCSRERLRGKVGGWNQPEPNDGVYCRNQWSGTVKNRLETMRQNQPSLFKLGRGRGIICLLARLLDDVLESGLPSHLGSQMLLNETKSEWKLNYNRLCLPAKKTQLFEETTF